MPDILQCFTIKAPAARVFDGVSTAEGLDKWWTKTSKAQPRAEGEYTLDFGPGYVWKAKATKYAPETAFEMEFTEADADWTGARVGWTLTEKKGRTEIEFYHTGWPEANAHYRISTYCWAMYLRILKRYLEYGEEVPYEKRLSV